MLEKVINNLIEKHGDILAIHRYDYWVDPTHTHIFLQFENADVVVAPLDKYKITELFKTHVQGYRLNEMIRYCRDVHSIENAPVNMMIDYILGDFYKKDKIPV